MNSHLQIKITGSYKKRVQNSSRSSHTTVFSHWAITLNYYDSHEYLLSWKDFLEKAQGCIIKIFNVYQFFEMTPIIMNKTVRRYPIVSGWFEYSKLITNCLAFFYFDICFLEYYLTCCCTTNVNGILHTKVCQGTNIHCNLLLYSSCTISIANWIRTRTKVFKCLAIFYPVLELLKFLSCRVLPSL